MNEIQRSTYLLDFTFTAKKSYICKLILLLQAPGSSATKVQTAGLSAREALMNGQVSDSVS